MNVQTQTYNGSAITMAHYKKIAQNAVAHPAIRIANLMGNAFSVLLEQYLEKMIYAINLVAHQLHTVTLQVIVLKENVIRENSDK